MIREENIVLGPDDSMADYSDAKAIRFCEGIFREIIETNVLDRIALKIFCHFWVSEDLFGGRIYGGVYEQKNPDFGSTWVAFLASDLRVRYFAGDKMEAVMLALDAAKKQPEQAPFSVIKDNFEALKAAATSWDNEREHQLERMDRIDGGSSPSVQAMEGGQNDQ